MAHRKRGRSPFSLFSFQDIITCVSGIIILITLVLALELSQRKQGSPKIQTAKLTAQLREAIADAQAEVARLEADLNRSTTKAQELAGVSPPVMQRDLFAINEQIKSFEAEIALLQKQDAQIAEEDVKMQAKRFDREKENKKLAEEELEVKDFEDRLKQVRQQNRLYYNPRTADGKKVWLVQIEADRTLVAAAGSGARPLILRHEFVIFRQTGFEKWLARRSSARDFIFLLVMPEATDEFGKLKRLVTTKGFSMGFDLLGGQQIAVDVKKGAGAP